MTERRCETCGAPMAAQANFCAECGASAVRDGAASTAAAVPPRATSPNAKTLLHYGALTANPDGHAIAAPAAWPPEPPASAARPRQATMLGIPSSSTREPEGAARLPPAAPAPDPRAPPLGKQTMLGVSAGPAPAFAPAAPKAPAAPSAKQTMLGVALPGIAPLRASAGASPPAVTAPTRQTTAAAPRPGPSRPDAVRIEPPPDALPDLPAPVPPTIVRRRGVPLAVAALLAGVLVLAVGLAIFASWRAGPPIHAVARSSADGNDLLAIHCDPQSCKDGTTVSLGAARATFAGGDAELTLAEPLHVGDNHLSLVVDRPGLGHDENIALVVPVAYRVRADVSPMRASPTGIAIRVEAVPGSDVVIDGKKVALDAHGAGELFVDETAATTGPADESKPVGIDFGYTITAPGQPAARGTVSARVSVAPLRVDAPGQHTVVAMDHVVVAGRAAKGASVTVDGNPVDVAADGSFEARVALADVGERTIEVRSGTSTLTPRLVRVNVERTANLAAAAKAFEARAKAGYDAVLADIAAYAGQPIVVEGEVIDARTVGHRTVALIDDRRGCAKGPCLARVVAGQELALQRNRTARAFGTVARAYNAGPGQTVPEVEADFVLQPNR